MESRTGNCNCCSALIHEVICRVSSSLGTLMTTTAATATTSTTPAATKRTSMIKSTEVAKK